MTKKKAVILGSGSFGTALATLLEDCEFEVTIWGRDEAVVDEINTSHANSAYLPDIEIAEGIRATTDLGICADADLILVVIPSKVFRQVCERVKSEGVPEKAILVSATKGIEISTGQRMTEVLRDVFPENPVGVISGPTHAEEIARKKPAAAVVASPDAEVAEQLQEIFSLPWFRPYSSTDCIGIEIGGTVKNICAIAAGIVQGLELGDNAKAGLVTRGLAEIVRLGVAMGGDPQTFLGLSGVGDLIVTCFSDHSRNNRVGRMLGQGMTLSEIQSKMKMVAEGVPNTESVYRMAEARGVRVPITYLLFQLLQEKITLEEAAQQLLSRSPRPEQG